MELLLEDKPNLIRTLTAVLSLSDLWRPPWENATWFLKERSTDLEANLVFLPPQVPPDSSLTSLKLADVSVSKFNVWILQSELLWALKVHWSLLVGGNQVLFYFTLSASHVDEMFPRWSVQASRTNRLASSSDWQVRVGSFDLGPFNPIRAQWIHHLLDNNFLVSLVMANDISVPALCSALCVDSFSSCVWSPLNRSSGSSLSGASPQMGDQIWV